MGTHNYLRDAFVQKEDVQNHGLGPFFALS